MEVNGRNLQVAFANMEAFFNAVFVAVELEHLLVRQRPIVSDQQITTISLLGLPQGIGVDLPAQVDLTGVDLTGSDFTGANLSGAVLRNTDLSGADLTDAVLAGTDFTGANLAGADLNQVDLSNAVLTDATLEGAYCDWATKLPEAIGLSCVGVTLAHR